MDLFLVKPNLGNPLILQPKDITEGFELTFAGKTNQCLSSWQMLLELRNGIFDLKLKKIDGSRDYRLTIIGRPYRKKVYSNPTENFPVTSQDHQYEAGFRWEYAVKVKSDDNRENEKWPQMFDIHYYAKRTHYFYPKPIRTKETNYHAVCVDTKLPTSNNLILIHVTDLHVAVRNDRIPEILSEVRSKPEKRKLYAKYHNFNNNLRAVIKYANKKIKKGERVILVATGDLTDYYHDGFFAWKNRKTKRSTSNVQKLVDIITGRDKLGQALQCPIFTVLGNHDYLLNEPPLRIDMSLLKRITINERDTNKAFNLTDNEGREYDYWMRGCPGYPPGSKFPKELWSTNSEKERRKYIKKHGGWDFNLDIDQSYSLGKPEYRHLGCYMEMINYDTDFEVSIGVHQFMCLNTGQDIYPSKNEFVHVKNELDRAKEGGVSGLILGALYTFLTGDFVTGASLGAAGLYIGKKLGFPDELNDYLNGGPHNKGISDEHLSLLTTALRQRSHGGLVLAFTHAPLLNLPMDCTEGIDILFEDKHKKASNLPNKQTVWLGKYLSEYWKKSNCMEADSIEKKHVCKMAAFKYFQQHGYPQAKTTYFKQGKRDDILNFGCADGKVDEFFRLIAPSGNVLRPLNVLFSGHTHAVHEFRVKKFASLDRFTFYIDDYSGSRKNTPQSLRSRSNAQKRKIWLNNHQPLLVTSGALKRKDPEFREVVIKGNNIQSMKMKHLPRLGDENNGIEYFYAAMSVELKKLQGKSVTSNRVYLYVTDAKRRNSRDYAMILLMEACRQILRDEINIFSVSRVGLAREYTNITLWLNSFGVDFGGGPRNTMVPEVHRNWAMTADRQAIYDGIYERIIDIFDFMKHEAGGNHLLCAWFTHESLYLAKLGGYDNPYRNSLDPAVHMRWALSVNFAVVIEDIRQKFRLQFDRLYAKRDKNDFLNFCGESSVRFASWGAGFTSRFKPSMDPANYRSQYATLIRGRDKDIEGVWKQLSYKIGQVTSALLIGGSGY